MATILKPYDTGCEPSPSVPAETLIQDGWDTYLLFFAVSKQADEAGYLKDLGVAVLECKECSVAKFGYPNDEGRPEHPFYGHGMDEATSSVLEVVGSHWAQEVALQMSASAQRIWGARSTSWKPSLSKAQRHFIILLKEKTFECVASDLKVVLFAETFEKAFAYVSQRLADHQRSAQQAHARDVRGRTRVMRGVMPMKIEGSDNVRDIFSIFHDGSLISHASDGDELALEISIQYLAERIDPNYRKFNVRLFGVSGVQFSTWPSDPTAEAETLTEIGEIFGAELEVLEGNIKGGFIEVVCNQHSPKFGYCGGELRFRCVYAVVTDEAGKAYSIEELDVLCKGYWDDWSKRNQA